MFANVKRERERDWCRHIKVSTASVDRQVEREVCVCVCMCVLFEFRQFVFRLRISKFCVDLRKKNLIVRDV